MRIIAAIVIALILFLVVHADEAENKQNERVQVIKKCAAYLEKKDTGREHSRWIAKVNSRMNDMCAAIDISPQAAADRILTEYLQSIRSEIADNKPEKMQDKTRIELCRWVILYASNDWVFDPKVMESLTLKNFKTWIDGGEDKP